jgi:VanZ family protein
VPDRSARRERRLLAAAVLVQLVVLYAPRAPSTAGLPGVDKVVHVAVFAAVAVTARRCRLPVLPVGLVLLAHAALSEVLQHAVLPGRSGDVLDVVADAAGVALGLLLARGYGSPRPAAREKVDRA